MEGLHVLGKAAGVELLRFRDALQGLGDAGIALLPGGSGVLGIEHIPGAVLVQGGTAQQLDGAAGAGGFALLLRGDLAALGLHQPAEDGGVLPVLGGSEAEGVGDHLQGGVLHCQGTAQIMALGVHFAQIGAAEATAGQAVHKGGGAQGL